MSRMVANSVNMQTAFVAAPSKTCSQSRGIARLSQCPTPKARVVFTSGISGQKLVQSNRQTSRAERVAALRVCAIKDGAVLDRKLRVAVIGGGPSGACTAETLAKGGIEAFLIERKLDNCKVPPCCAFFEVYVYYKVLLSRSSSMRAFFALYQKFIDERECLDSSSLCQM